VSDEARERVLEVIEEHDYRPNSMARSLATDRSYEISILTPRRGDESLASGYWPLLYSGIFEQCLERGYFVSLSMVSEEVKEQISDRAGDNRFDGYMLITREVTEIVHDAFKERDVPTVLIGYNPEWEDLHSIDIDNVEGGYKAGAHLCGLGHNDIGVILGTPQLQETIDRRRGFAEALDEAGCTVPSSRIAMGDYSQESGYEAIYRWHEDGSMPGGLFCASDTMAMGALLALNETGHRVPDDVAVVGFDGLPSSGYTIPPLTTVKQPVYEKGQTAANRLIDEIEEKNEMPPTHTELTPELVVRQSCGSEGQSNR
jgi:LacI family transcriptional regulator